jgi:hypothetical protein
LAGNVNAVRIVCDLSEVSGLVCPASTSDWRRARPRRPVTVTSRYSGAQHKASSRLLYSIYA